jgi:hypothetical protein
MQTFRDTVTSQVYAFEDDVVVTNTAGVYTFKTVDGSLLETLPATLVPYVVPTPEPVPGAAAAAAAGVAFAAGLAVTSTATPALNGTYPIDPATQAHMQAEVIAILLNGTFADGTGTVVWADTGGEPHTFGSVGEFKVFASTIAAYVAALYKYASGILTTLPTATATIP